MRPLRCCCQALHGELDVDAASRTTCLGNSDQLPSVLEKIGAAGEATLAAFRDEIGGDGSSGSSREERKTRRRVEEDFSAHAGELLPQVAYSVPSTSTAGLPNLQHDCSAASVDGRCHQRTVPVVFSQDFTHVELDALLGSTLCWKDPFEETRKTVGGLEASWMACLDSLCGRLRVTVPEADVCGGEETGGGGLPGGGKEVATSSEDDSTGALVSENPGAFPGSADGSQRRLAANADVEGQGSPAVQVAAGDTVKTGHPTSGLAVATGNDESHGRAAARALPLVRRRRRSGAQPKENAGEGVWFDKTILRVGARVPWGRLQRGRFAKVLFTVSLGEAGNGFEFAATSNSPTADPMLRGRWDFRAADRDLARYLSSGHAAVTRAKNRPVKPHAYDPRRCTVELQERGELEWACTVIARTAFRLVMVVPGGVVLSLAGVAIVGGREVAWPQDIEEDKVLYKASSDIQSAWRGCTSRKRTRWLRMEREGRRRLSRMRKEAEHERERTRLLEEEATAKLALEENRRIRAQVVLAATTRGQAARQETSRRRAEQTARQRQLDQEAEQEEADKAAAAAVAAARSSLSYEDNETGEDNGTAESEPMVGDDHGDSTTPGVARLERVVTIDGTAVHLTAHVKEAVDGGGDGNSQPLEMLLVAVDEKARRSSRLSLGAADIREMVGADQAGKGGNMMRGAQGTLSAVLRKLTLFNSRRKDLFILSYRGKKVVAPH